jgi:hypothetical protein
VVREGALLRGCSPFKSSISQDYPCPDQRHSPFSHLPNAMPSRLSVQRKRNCGDPTVVVKAETTWHSTMWGR